MLIGQLTTLDIDRFHASWRDGIRANPKNWSAWKSFVRFYAKRDWLGKNIAEDLEAPEGSSTPTHKTPFTDAEMERIYTVCARSFTPGYRIGW